MTTVVFKNHDFNDYKWADTASKFLMVEEEWTMKWVIRINVVFKHRSDSLWGYTGGGL